MRLSSLLAGAAISLSLLVGAGTAAAQTRPNLNIEVVTTPITEGEHGVFRISIDPAQTAAFEVPITVSESLSATITIGKVFADGATQPTSVTIPANASSVTLSIATDDNSTDQRDDRAVGVALNRDRSRYTLSNGFVQVTVMDNDDPPMVSIAAAPNARAGTPLNYPVRLSAASEWTVTVDYTTAALPGTAPVGSAMPGVEYTATSGTLTFDRGETEKTVSVPTLIADVSRNVLVLNLQLRLSNAQNVGQSPAVNPTISTPSALGIIISPTPTLAIENAGDSRIEGTHESAVFIISSDETLTEALVVPVSVTETVESGRYIKGTPPTTVTIQANSSTARLTVFIEDDDRFERTSAIIAVISNPDASKFVLARSTIFVAVNDNDDPPMVNVAAAPNARAGASLNFKVSLTAESEGTVTVDYITSDGTAVAGTDYTATNGTLIFQRYETEKTVSVPTLAAGVNKNLHLRLSNAQHAGLRRADWPTISTTSAMGNIISQAPTLKIENAGDSRVEGTHESAVFIISSSETATEAVVVPVTVMEIESLGRYIKGTPPTTVTIQANSSTARLTVFIEDDDRFEKTSAFTAEIDNQASSNFVLDLISIAVAVNPDNDPLPIFRVQALQQGAGEGIPLEFQVSLTPASDITATIRYTTSDGTATTADMDYTATNGTLTFAPGETRMTVTVATEEDTDSTEGDETMHLVLFRQVDARIGVGANSASSIIRDKPALSITADKTSYMENEAASLTISINSVQTTPVVVPLTVTAGVSTVIGGTPPTSVTIPANSSATVLTLAFDDDERQDDPTKVTVTIGSPDSSAYAVVLAEVVLDVEDDGDAAPMISFGTVQNAAETTPLRFPVTLTAESDRTVIVHYATSDGTATAGADYTAASGILTFLPRVTARTVSVPTLLAADNGETVFLRLANADGATIATSAATDGAAGAIIELPVISIVADTAAVVESADAVFTITVNLGPTQDVALPLTLTQTGDFLNNPPGSVTIPAGEVSVKLTIALDDDATDEDNGSITVTLSNPDPLLYVLGADSASVTVEDDDSAPTVSAKAVADAREGDSLLFLVSLSAVSGKVASVGYATEDGTTTEGEDYEAARGQLTFQPGATEQTVAVTTIRDTVKDPDETLHLVLAAPTNASLDMQAGTHRATGTIVEGLNEEEMRQLSEAILPYVASALGNVTSRALQDRTKVALGGLQPKGISVRGSSLSQFLVAQAKTASDPALFNRGLSQAPGIHPAALDADLPYTSLDQWQAQADARAAAGSHNHPRLGVGDLDFTMALSGGQQGRQSADGSLNLWGSGYYTDFANNHSEMPFDGKVTGGMIGIDMLYAGWLMGVAVNRTETDVDWRYKDFTGSHEITLTGFHPYVARQLDEHTRIWFTLGHEQGEVEITEDGGPDLCSFCKFDVTMTSAALGVSSRLHETATENGTARINFIADGSYSQIKGDTRQAITAAASWLRLGLELDYQRALTGNKHLGSSVELVMRSDFEDARRGNGWELGGNLDLVMPELGLRLDLAVRTLLAHSADVDEWGISGGVRWAVLRQGGKGLSLAFKPQWGALGSARDALWEHGLSTDYNQSQADATGPGRYTLELTYGLPILHGQDLLTLFTRSNQKATGRDLTLGADLTLGPHFTSGYELLLPQSTTTTNPPEHRAFIRYQRAF